MNANHHALNRTTLPLLAAAKDHAESLRIASHPVEGGGTVLDFGCSTRGGIAAGLLLAKICMANRAEVSLAPSDPQRTFHPLLSVSTDAPSLACMASQYAGWKISHGDFFAMGSGPMRAKRGKEAVLEALAIEDRSENAIGVLECDALPGPDVVASVATACGVAPSEVTLCVAPTTSLAGVLQVVARSIETSLHKLFELGFPLEQILSGHGTAPVPPISKDAVSGIGRTNDAILYGGHVTLWVDAEESLIREIAPQVPSCASSDYGKPFAETFKHYGYDFYKVDPGLFAPGMLTMINVRSGKSLRVGRFHLEVLQQSFGESTA
jgi:methenyltetrahydromethanopterin cyclohydrolase